MCIVLMRNGTLRQFKRACSELAVEIENMLELIELEMNK